MQLGILLSIFSILSENIANIETLISSMHNRYHNNYNKNITFIQKNIDYHENGSKTVTVLYEAHHYPGNFRVDYGFIPNKNGVIYSNDSIYNFKDGVHTSTDSGKNEVVFLTGDVYYVHPEKSINALHKMGFDVSKFRTATFYNKKSYVIGSNSITDTTSMQFWIDAENLYLVRLIKYNKITHQIEDHHFVEHEKVGDAWVENKVIVFSKGRKIREEEYTEVSPNEELEPTIFNPKFWGKVHWHKKK